MKALEFETRLNEDQTLTVPEAVAAQVPPQVFMRYALPAFVLVLVMLAGVALFGDVRNGARRWLPLGFASVQPSELMKLALVLYAATPSTAPSCIRSGRT